MDPLNKQASQAIQSSENLPLTTDPKKITEVKGGGGSKTEELAQGVFKGVGNNSLEGIMESLVDRVSVPISAPLQILNAKSGFYVGCLLPEALTSKGKEILKVILGDSDIKLSTPAQAHITVIPPSKELKPQINIGEVLDASSESAVPESAVLKFTKLAISPTGDVSLLAPDKNKGYEKICKACSKNLNSPANEGVTHAVFTTLKKDDLQQINQSFAHYGLKEETFQGGIVFYTSSIDEIALTIKCPTTMPDEQYLLSVSHREGIEPDLKAAQKYSQRKEQIKDLHNTIFSFEELEFSTFPCPHTFEPLEFTRKDLEAAIYGIENVETGEIERRPIPFSKMDEPETKWSDFKEEINVIFKNYGIMDAEVHILGSAGTGFSGNPMKPFKAWTHKSDLDCAIFSKQLSLYCAKSEIAVNTKIVQGEKFTVYKNKVDTGSGGRGFHETFLGKELEALQRKWSDMLYEKYGDVKATGEEVDIKVNIGTDPFKSTIGFKVK